MSEILNGFGDDWNKVEAYSGSSKPKKLPTGGYILKIIGAKISRTSNGKAKIVLAFDIDEGEYKGYFADYLKYDQGFRPDAKTRGIYDMFYPDKGNGSEDDLAKFEKSLATLKGAVTAINESNPNSPKIDVQNQFTLDSFVGKRVGGIFGDVEWRMNGKSGMSAKCRWFTNIENIRTNNFTIPEPKYQSNSTTPQVSSLADTGLSPSDFNSILSDGDVPF